MSFEDVINPINQLKQTDNNKTSYVTAEQAEGLDKDSGD